MLWQKHNLRIEEFMEMPRRTRLFYIASEGYEMDHPVRLDTIRFKKGGGA